MIPAAQSWLEKPRLEIVPSIWQPQGPVLWSFAVVRVKNKPLPPVLGAILRRDVAPRCTVSAKFIGAPFHPIDARWSAAVQPFRLVDRSGALAVEYAPELVPSTKEFDLAPSEDGQEVAVAIVHADGSAHAFSASSYSFMDKEWADPALALEGGTTYSVRISARSAGQEKVCTLELPYLNADFNRFVLRKPQA